MEEGSTGSSGKGGSVAEAASMVTTKGRDGRTGKVLKASDRCMTLMVHVDIKCPSTSLSVQNSYICETEDEQSSIDQSIF